MDIVYKEVGETPLQCLERFRAEKGLGEDVPLTYAGRLDPMAEGLLLILSHEECKKKDQYLGLDKVYETEIVFGFSTDTYDALGLVVSSAKFEAEKIDLKNVDMGKYIGEFIQEYPPYSSKPVSGKPLFAHAREGTLGDIDSADMPTKKVTIYSIDVLGERMIGAGELFLDIKERVGKVKGDFRQKEIIGRWEEVLGLSAVKKAESIKANFKVLKLRVSCSSGTYVRSLAHRIGNDIQCGACGAFALSIKRTQVGNFILPKL